MSLIVYLSNSSRRVSIALDLLGDLLSRLIRLPIDRILRILDYFLCPFKIAVKELMRCIWAEWDYGDFA